MPTAEAMAKALELIGLSDGLYFACCRECVAAALEAHAEEAVEKVLREMAWTREQSLLCDRLDLLAGRPVGTLLKRVRGDA